MPNQRDGSRAAGKAPTGKRKQDWWSSFVPGDLSQVEKELCRAWVYWDTHQSEMLDKLCRDGYKVSCKMDTNGRGFAAMIQPIGEDHIHAGWILSGRGSTSLKAIKQACYRHFAQFDEQWPLLTGEEGQEDFGD